MNNKVVFAAAGNGKTFRIAQEAVECIKDSSKYILIISYTNEGVRAIEEEFRYQNGGVIDERIVIKSWYSFLLSEMIKPYQCLLKLKYKYYKQEHNYEVRENFIRSIAFYESEKKPNYYNSAHIQFYINNARDIWKDDVSHLAHVCVDHSQRKVIERMESLFSHIFIDELQDYAGWDLEIIRLLFESKITIKCVGDYKQVTYRTNNSPKNRQYRDENIRCFFREEERKGHCTLEYQNTTRRCCTPLCDYINTIHNDPESAIKPHRDIEHFDEDNSGMFIINSQYMETYCRYYNPVILRYNIVSNIQFNHSCKIYNYGSSKGDTFDRVVIIPVNTVIPFITHQQPIAADATRAKFYVACTRARYSVVFVMDNADRCMQFKETQLKLGHLEIPAYRYCGIQDVTQ